VPLVTVLRRDSMQRYSDPHKKLAPSTSRPTRSNYFLRMKDLDRRLSVAPMMDWTGQKKSGWQNNDLAGSVNACR
jgi:hypothetical protein